MYLDVYFAFSGKGYMCTLLFSLLCYWARCLVRENLRSLRHDLINRLRSSAMRVTLWMIMCALILFALCSRLHPVNFEGRDMVMDGWMEVFFFYPIAVRTAESIETETL